MKAPLGHSLSLARLPVHVDEQDERHLDADEARGAQRETHLSSGEMRSLLVSAFFWFEVTPQRITQPAHRRWLG